MIIFGVHSGRAGDCPSPSFVALELPFLVLTLCLCSPQDSFGEHYVIAGEYSSSF